MKAVARRILWAAAALCVALLLFLAFLHTPAARGRVWTFVASRLEAAGIRASVERLDYNLFTLDVSARGLQLAAIDHDAPFLTVEEVRTGFDRSILAGHLSLISLDLRRPTIRLVRRADGALNLPSEGEGGGAFVVPPIGTIALDGLAFSYEDEPGQLTFAVEGLSTTLQPSASAPLEGEIASGTTYRFRSGDAESTGTIAGRVSFDGTDVGLQPLSVAAGEGTVQLEGRVRSVLDEPALDVAYDATLDLERLAPWIAVEDFPTGTVRVTGRAGGPTGSPTATAQAAGTLAWSGLTDVAVEADGEVSIAQVDIRRATASVAGGEIDAAGRFMFSDEAASEARLTWRGVAAAELANALAEHPLDLGTIVDGSLDVSWLPGGWSTLRLAVENTSRPDGSRGLGLDGRLQLTVEAGRWRATHDHRVGRAMAVSGTAGGQVGDSIGSSTLAGNAELTSGDLRAALDHLGSAGVPTGGLSQAMSAGETRASAVLSGTLAAPSVNATLTSEDVVAYGVGPLSVTGAITSSGDRIGIRGLDARSQTNLIRVESGTLDLSSGAVQARANAELRDLAQLTASLEPTRRAAGSLRADLIVGGTLSRPRIDLTAAGQSIQAAGQEFATLAARARVDGNAVDVSSLELTQADGGRLGGQVSYDLGSSRYRANVTGTGVRLSSVPPGFLTEGALNLAAGLDVTFEGEGTLDEPGGNATLGLTDLRLGGRSFGDAQAKVELRDRSAWVDLTVPQLALSAAGHVGAAAPHAFELDARLAGTDLTRLVEFAPGERPPIAGTATAGVVAAGDLSDLSNASVDATLEALTAQIDGRPIDLAGPARLSYRDGVVSAENVDLRAGAARLGLAGRLSRSDALGAVRATIAGPLDDIMPFARLAGAPADLGATGTIDVRVDATGSLDRLVLQGQFAIDEGALRWRDLPPASDLTARAVLQNGVLQLERLDATWQATTAQATGVVPVRLLEAWLPDAILAGLPETSRVATLRVRADPVTPQALQPWLSPEVLAELDGRMTATIDVEADGLGLEHVRGGMTIEDARFTVSGVPLAPDGPARITFADGRVDIPESRWTSGANAAVVRGTVDLTAEPPLVDLRTDGALDLRLATAFVPGATTGGVARLDLRVSGALDAPDLAGRIDLTDGQLRLRDPQIAITQVAGSLTLSETAVVVDRLAGAVNGGTLDITGRLGVDGFEPQEGRIDLVVRGAGLQYPAGFRSQIDADLALETSPHSQPALTGKVSVLRGAYRSRILLTTQLLQARTTTVIEGAEPSGLSALRLSIDVVTDDDVIVDNNYGRLEMGADLRLIGTLDRPALGGRAEVREGGEIFLGGNTYYIDRGTVDFLNPTRIEPTLDLSARTRVSGYDITMNVTGAPGRIETSFSSEPVLGQDDIVSVLLTGRTLDQVGSAQSQIAGEQVLGYLSGEVLSSAGRAVGLDRLRFERGLVDDTLRSDPALVATETDPSARLTVAKNLDENVEVVLSRNLRDGDLTVIASYRPRRRYEVRAISRDNNDRSYEFNQDLTFGGAGASGRSTRARDERRVSEVRFTGEPGFSEGELADVVRISAGDRFDFYRWQDDQDRLTEFYHDRDYLEAQVSARRIEAPTPDGGIALEYEIERGPETRLTIEGSRPSGRIVRSMREAWTRSVFDEFLVEEMRAIAQRWLVREGYLEGSTEAAIIRSTPDIKVLVVSLVQGGRRRSRDIVFEGNQSLGEDELMAQIEARELEVEAWIEPALAANAVREVYRSRGWLSVEVRVGERRLADGRATLPVIVEEGPRFVIGDVQVTGVGVDRREVVTGALGLAAGDPYDPFDVDAGRTAVEEFYRGQGYNRVETTMTAAVDREAARVALTLAIEEGAQQVLESVNVQGIERTRSGFLTDVLDLEVGAPVDQAAWFQARKRLYDTGVFRRVDIEPIPIETVPVAQALSGVEERVQARITVEEVPPIRFRYGLQINDERASVSESRDLGPGFTADVERRNLWGRAARTGVAFRYDRDRRVGRTYLIAPRFFGRSITSSLFLSRSREHFNPEGFLSFISDITGVTAEQRLRPAPALELSYSYRFERNHTFDPERDPDDPLGLDISVDVARLTATGIADTRDDPFDAARGWFHSSSLEYAPETLGSDLRFVKYLAQQYYFRPVGDRLVWASALRVGLARGIGQELIPSERFFAGGGNSVRGYREDSIGGLDVLGEPIGGNAMVVINQEARFPLFRWFRGVGFVDAGNVFPAIGDLSFVDLDVGIGLGLRIDTPVALIRADYGVPLSRVDGERRGRWFFSIGQAF